MPSSLVSDDSRDKTAQYVCRFGDSSEPESQRGCCKGAVCCYSAWVGSCDCFVCSRVRGAQTLRLAHRRWALPPPVVFGALGLAASFDLLTIVTVALGAPHWFGHARFGRARGRSPDVHGNMHRNEHAHFQDRRGPGRLVAAQRFGLGPGWFDASFRAPRPRIQGGLDLADRPFHWRSVRIRGALRPSRYADFAMRSWHGFCAFGGSDCPRPVLAQRYLQVADLQLQLAGHLETPGVGHCHWPRNLPVCTPTRATVCSGLAAGSPVEVGELGPGPF